ncbi:MAG: type II toxin-antitoxin system HipA family toxin [Mesorhizobium sp.]|nr:MAG: type II toxin-antitoxin system HipA family toxin [Mesorhizobium sp.]RWE05827.1 MAG: type II toxin-antitoxin system HipA family toxin [Mesorhizobium sp.]RWO03329.1 MAG: type II toxin-antitoxin system HipA family toxin [Mesorhizobium sp.]
MPDVAVLDIRLYGTPIATLTNIQGDRSIFAFNEDYVADEQRPTLSLSFKDNLGGLITRFRPTTTALTPFFSNLLPEGPLRRYLAERAGVNQKREFFLLWALGRDLPGALSVYPAEGEALPPGANNAVTEEERPNALRFSLAGVQLKFSALKNDRKGGGLTIPAEGVGGSWIVKLPSQQFSGVPENEFSMMTIARMMGMDVPDIDLIDLDAVIGLPDGIGEFEGQALAVRRFDRSADGPIHIEDFAQVVRAYPDDKYKAASYRNIGEVIGIETGDAGTAEYIRRLVYSTLIGNGDMHLKNWSLIYPDRRTPALAPAYDLLSTIPYIAGEDTAALNYSRTKKMAEVTTDELKHLAAKARLSEKLVLDTASETVQRFRDVWQSEKTNLPLRQNVISLVDAHAASIPIYTELR